MRYDEVAEHGVVAYLSKSWNAECKEAATWSFGSDAEGAGETDVWHRSHKFGKGERG